MTHIADLFKLNGKVALVTGGGKGLGFFSAEGLAEAGADIAICGRDIHGKLDKAVEKLKEINSNCIAIKCDITKEEEVKQMAKLMTDGGFGDIPIIDKDKIY